MQKTTLGQLINSKRDLPKVLMFCIILVAIAGSFTLYGLTWPSYFAESCLGFAVFMLGWHVKNAYLDDGDWPGFLIVTSLGLLCMIPLACGMSFFDADSPLTYRHLAAGVTWSATLLIVTVCWQWTVANSLLGHEEERWKGRNDFLNAVGIVEAWTAGTATAEHRVKTQQRIATRMEADLDALRVLVINGYDDLVMPGSPIRAALKEHIDRRTQKLKQARHRFGREDLGVRILLLDPFSSFATDRAKHLCGSGYSEQLSKQRYVRDFLDTTRELDTLGVAYKVYCSRPLFRFYLGSHPNQNQWCIAQHYLRNKHGYEAPTFEYEFASGKNRAEDCFLTLAGQAFEYLWDRGFSDYTTAGLSDPALVLYMASMYGLPIRDDLGNYLHPDVVRSSVIQFAALAFAEA